MGGNSPYKTQSCETSYPGQPYCVDRACSRQPDPGDEQCAAAGITCTGSGYFPSIFYSFTNPHVIFNNNV